MGMAGRGRAAAFGCALACLAIVGAGCGDDRLIDWLAIGPEGKPLLDRVLPMELVGGLPDVERERPIDPGAPEPRLGLVVHGVAACAGEGVELRPRALGAVEPITWRWEPAEGLSDPAARNPVAQGDQTRSYTVTATDATGAVATATVVVERHPLPQARIAIANGDDVACLGESLRVVAGAPPRPGAWRFAWDLDGNPATIETTAPAADFTPTADVVVALTVTDVETGCAATATVPIRVRQLPVPAVAFTLGSERVCAGEEVALDASASRDADGNPVATYAWDLDGDPSTVESNEALAGPWVASGAPARLRVTDAWGCTAWHTQPVVAGDRPVARIDFAAGAPLVCAGEQVILDGSASTDLAGAPVVEHAWDLDGDWSTVEASGPHLPALVPTGPQVVSLRVRDAWGCEGESAVRLDARPLPQPAIAFAQGRADACAGDAVALSGAGSVDADGAPVASLAWDLDGDGVADATGAQTAPFVPAAGQRVRLVVTDALGCSASAMQALAPRPLPTPAIEITEGAAALCSGEAVALSGAASRDADGNPAVAYAWDLDGDPATVEVAAAATGSFRPAGAATLTVTDAQGCSASARQLFDVGALPTPRIDFLAGGDLVCAGEPVQLDGSASTAAAGSALADWRWDLDGDGHFETSGPTPPAFAPVGAVTARLRVEDARGCRAEAVQPLAARPLPVAAIAFAAGAGSVCAGEAVALDGGASTDADGSRPVAFSWDLDGDGVEDASAPATGSFVPAGAALATLTVTDAFGCTGTATQPLEARRRPTAVLDFLEGGALVCAGDRVRLDGSRSHAADGGPVASWTWDLDGDGVEDATGATPAAFTPAAGATARLVVTDATGCTAAASQRLDVRALPTPRITVTQGATAICDGGILGFSGAASTDADGAAVVAWSWDLDGDGIEDRAGPVTGSLQPGASGAARLTVTDRLGCSASADQPWTVWPLPVVDAGPDARFCAGGSTVLGTPALPGLTYAWSPAAGLDDPTAAQPTATPTGPTRYTVTATDANGCTATDTVQVDVFPMPVADAGPDRQVARGGQVRLLGAASGGTPAFAFAWSPAAPLDDAAAAQPLAGPAADTTFILTVTDANGCTDTDEVRVEVRPGLAVAASADVWRCLDSGEPVTLSATATGGVAPITWRWSADPPCASCIASPDAPTTLVAPDVTTTFTITATDANGTTSSDQVTVTVLPSIAASGIAGPDKYIQRGDSVQIGTDPIPGLSYRWTCDNWSCAISDHNAADPWVAPSGNTVYRVEVTDGATCRGSDEVQIFMDVRVVATVPTEGHGRWPRDALLWVTFDTDMDPASFAGNVILWNPGNGQMLAIDTRYDPASRTLEVDPISYPQNNRPAVLQIRGGPTGVQSVAGDIMYSDFLLEYNASSMGDGRAPAAAWTQPAAGATNVPRAVDVVIRFDETVDPGSVNGSTVYIAGVPATVSYDPRNWTALIRPAQPLAPNTAYTVRVDGVRDGPGNAANFSFTFTTGSPLDTTPPQVVTSLPLPNELAFDVGTPLSVTFSEPIDATTIGGFRLIDEATGFPVAGEILYDPQTRTATLDPGRMLLPEHDYRLVASGILDEAGNAMAAPYVARFRTTRVVFLERFETGAQGWTLDAPWATHFQGTRAGAFGLVDSPAGNYAPGLSIAAVTPPLDVAGRPQVALSFWNRRLLATDADRLLVEASTNGSTWTTVGTIADPAGWRQWTGTIATGGASQLRVRLRLTTNGSVQMDGVFIDELVVR